MSVPGSSSPAPADPASWCADQAQSVLVPGFDATLTAFADPDGALEVAVIEHLRVRVRADARSAWLHAEAHSWEPWLQQQAGYLGRELRWDAEREEGVLLIRWASREQWKAIPEDEVERVQKRFEALARQSLGAGQAAARPPLTNPFPLVHASELEPGALAVA
ncbi:MAG: TIGR03792 family protein [Synechococcaceae cyanobacterium]|nr:TIGR03792 family protein [Synechococcaceae cyanobacterium]